MTIFFITLYCTQFLVYQLKSIKQYCCDITFYNLHLDTIWTSYLNNTSSNLQWNHLMKPFSTLWHLPLLKNQLQKIWNKLYPQLDCAILLLFDVCCKCLPWLICTQERISIACSCGLATWICPFKASPALTCNNLFQHWFKQCSPILAFLLSTVHLT